MRTHFNGGGSAAWTRKEGKFESGGLNQKGPRQLHKRDVKSTNEIKNKSKT